MEEEEKAINQQVKTRVFKIEKTTRSKFLSSGTDNTLQDESQDQNLNMIDSQSILDQLLSLINQNGEVIPLDDKNINLIQILTICSLLDNQSQIKEEVVLNEI